MPALAESSIDAFLVTYACMLRLYMSHGLNSFKGGYIGDYIGTTIGDINGDTKSLDYSSYMFSLGVDPESIVAALRTGVLI